jgi:AcrR family transcriptional regulator
LDNDLDNGRFIKKLGHCPKNMKKAEPGLETKIVDTALKMFNERGIEYVGMRELAAKLDIRIGNMTYYFPTKDDLVNRISLHLAEDNSKTIIPVEQITMPRFFEMLQQVFRNHLKYRCLMLSFVHIVQRNPVIARRYNKTQADRNATWLINIQALADSKYIIADKPEVEFLVSSIALIARFWISEAAVSFRNQSEGEQIQYYMNMIARIFLPYATAKGKKYLVELLSE